MFSYATARSYNTSHKVTQGLTAKFPLIVYNGVMIRDNISGEILYKCFFDKQQATDALMALGYSKNEAEQSVGKVKDNDLRAEDYIKFALKNM